MEVTAKVRFIRMSPRKVRLVVDLVRGLPVDKALTQLHFLNKAAALPVRKLLQSAVANAEHNFNLKADNLFIKNISADGGPIIHRWRPRAFGRAAAIRKRTSHVNITLAEIKPAETKKPAAPAKKTEVKKAEKKVESTKATKTAK